MKIPKFDPRLAAELRRQRGPIAAGLVCVVCTAILTAASIGLMKYAFQALEEKDATLVGQASLAIVGLFLLKYFFNRAQVYYLQLGANRLAADLRERLFAKVQRLPIAYFNERRAGAIQSVFTNDLSVYQNAIGIIRDSIQGPIKAIGAFVAVFVLQWKLALIAIVFLPIMALAIQRNSRKVRATQAHVQKDLAEVNAATHEAIQGARIIKAFSAEEAVEENYRDLVGKTLESQMRSVRKTSSIGPLVELIGAVAVAIVLYVGGTLASRGELLVSDLIALIYALDVVNQGMKNLASVSNFYSQVQAAADRIYGEVLDYPEQHAEEEVKKTLPAPEGRLEYKAVGFAYPDGTRALREVSFILEPGTSLALVGPSGAGKSTIADLLLRFYDPTEGSIEFDGENVRNLNASWLRGQIGVVPQQTFLFAGTIAENIRLGNPAATDEEVREAARTAHASSFIEAMPDQYETQLGERGVRLSGGEMQRIAIARAVVRKPRLLLLDEATSNLDAVSEKAVQEALEEVMRGRTTLFIAHRLTTAARADRILVLSSGEVLEYGSHGELIAANGAYAAMFEAFSKGLMDEAIDREGFGFEVSDRDSERPEPEA
jgi:subfamily B ATP-binding cassette protein MsbA